MATYQASKQRSSRKSRKVINVHQNSFPKAYISTIDNSRRDQQSLSDMTNMELVQDNVTRPRPPAIRYGTQPTFPVVGRGKFRYNGQRGLLWLFNVAGVGKIYRQVDGGDFLLVGGSYPVTGWTMFTQSKTKIYPYNTDGSVRLSYIDLSDWSVHTYTALSTPTISSVTGSANLVSGTKPYTYYYRVSSNNEVGESIASVAFAVTVNIDRDHWSSEAAIAKTVAIVWTIPTGASSTTIYIGDKLTALNELITLGDGVTTYTDDGSLQVNPYKLAPEANSTQGFYPRWLYNDSKNSQIFGIGENNKMYYSAPGTADFSSYNGGGWVSIDEDGDTELNFLDGFRDGKGDPVITTSSRGAAGKGLLNHVTFATLNVGDQIITYPNVYPASGQVGTYAPRATLKNRDSLTYPTGQDFMTTGTSQNIVNILTSNRIAQGIEPDLANINLAALKNAVGDVDKDRLFFCLPVGASYNNEIWYIDQSRKNAWVLRWPIAVTDMWHYEDNSGATHWCILSNNVILEFTRAGATPHQDDGVAWRSRLAFDALVWDPDGITLGKVRKLYHKLLNPKGDIVSNATGLTRKGVSQAVGSDSFSVQTTPTGYDIWTFDTHKYDEDPGTISTFGKSVAVLEIKPKGLLNQLSWEIIGQTAGTDYTHSATNARGWSSDDLIMKT